MSTKYIVVGGNPFRGMNGTGTFTGLRVVGSSDCEAEIKRICNDNYDACGGLLLVIDTTTGKEKVGGDPETNF